MRSLFINLPVADTAASKAFYEALGFPHNPDFSDDGATCIVISEHLYVMAMERARFQGFIEGEIAPAGTVEALHALSCDSREEVDQLVTKAKQTPDNEERMQIRVAVAEHPAGPFIDSGKRLTAEHSHGELPPGKEPFHECVLQTNSGRFVLAVL
jgi:predicted lactoylglutathione lyase